MQIERSSNRRFEKIVHLVRLRLKRQWGRVSGEWEKKGGEIAEVGLANRWYGTIAQGGDKNKKKI